MMPTTRVETEDHRPVVVKRVPPAGAARLRREAERLERASHPGVVPIVRAGPAVDGWELCTGHGGRPLATVGALTAAQVAGLGAGIAATLADLHDLGVVHGRIDASHVLLGAHGRPVLCGFGDGEPPARPEDDVAAVGSLLVALLGAEEAGEPIPDRRWWGHRGWSGWERRALLLVADQATAEPPIRRPNARRLAAAIAEAVPGTARIETPREPAEPSATPREDDVIERLRASVIDDTRARRPRRGAVALVLGGALLVGLGAIHTLAGDPPPDPAVVEPAPGTTSDDPSADWRTATPVAGAVLDAGGRRYRVGDPGDEVLVDDWDCDGASTPALLRPATGDVFVFPRWVSHGWLAVPPVLHVPDAQALVSEVADGACPTLAVRTRDGEMVAVIEAVR